MHPWQNLHADDTEALAAAYDDVPLWSAPFGLALLEAVRLRGVQSALDVGCGTGFPLLELAARLGPGARLVGLDPWKNALARARRKCEEHGLANVELVAGVAEQMPFAAASFDLAVSNNGLNNIDAAERALGEIHRVLRPGGQLVMTVNLPDTMREFYDLFDALLLERGEVRAREALREHIWVKRKPAAWWQQALQDAGFKELLAQEGSFAWRFADARALFSHWFIRLGFLEAWTQVVPPEWRDELFVALQSRLEERAVREGELRLTIPFVCIAASR
jgi:arsenite methyltransferase